MSSALIVWGGWDGHEPKPLSEIFAKALTEKGFDVEVSDTLDAFKDEDKLAKLDLIVPIWTMGSIAGDQLGPMLKAIRGGVGVAGCHGGMGDAFRNETEYQFMVGGQWVAHPGGDQVTYDVNIVQKDNPIVKGIADFKVTSEQYYMHTDPGNNVLATTNFGDVVMPVVWTKKYGEGKVFYSSLGHVAKTMLEPECLEIQTRGMLWAAGKL